MAKGLYGAYRAAGKAGGAYKASLYDIEAVGSEKESSQQAYEIESQRRESMFATIGAGVELAGQISADITRRAEISKDIESLGEAKYEKSLKDFTGPTQGPSQPWDKLSAEEKFKWTPTQTKKTGLFGLGDPLYEFEGEEFKQSELLNIAGIRKSETLLEKFDLGSSFYKDKE
jgi:hypothetical protein